MESEDQSRTYETASVLFMDIVGYSPEPIDRQADLLRDLQKLVGECKEFQRAQSKNDLISLPTGDGMALVFLRDTLAPVRCALEVAGLLKDHPRIRLRMGIHSGQVTRHLDINGKQNVVGDGINLAQRVMDCGDAGHILISQAIADVMNRVSEWQGSLLDLGIRAVKHGEKLHIYSLSKDGAGNPALPAKLGRQRAWRPAWVVLGVVIIAAAIAGIVLRSKFSTPPPAPERPLRYYVVVQKYRGGAPFENSFRLSGERVFEADYRIRLVFSAPQPGYLYLLNEGPDSTHAHPVFNTLFPTPLTNEGSALLDSGQKLEIPQGGPFVFDAKKGTEKLWLVWSKWSLPEIEDLKKWANAEHRGKISDPAQLQAVEAFVEKYGVNAPKVERDDAGQLTTLRATGDIVVHLLKLEHD